ncbi:Mediator complex, subunit Med18, metazoa/fungi [Lasallia pustulata]|uniref:Mediator of RNA polymerase II transcription subunit 18 n=1 Tax=Lasallia pustulata TaxID=136370 RepID=A0A1W5DB78_9LECA|nr:Mediator complex, subunit Med18, metazoa/fungi [Lasallia pustulata]
MQPQRVVQRHLIFKPSPSPIQRGGQVGGSQGVQGAQIQALQGQMHGDLFFLQLVGDIAGSSETVDSAADPKDVMMSDDDKDGSTGGKLLSNGTSQSDKTRAALQTPQQTWLLQFRDLPEAGRRPVTSRLMADIAIISGNTLLFMEALGYQYTTEYILSGSQFIHGNLILLLHHHLRVPTSASSVSPRGHVPAISALQPLDPSGTYLLQASIRVQDGNKPESMSIGINELKAFKDLMKGVLEMEVGDRLALDTRAR